MHPLRLPRVAVRCAGTVRRAARRNSGFADKIRVRSYPTQSWVGLIFAYFGEDEPPPLPQPGEWQKASLVENRNYLRQSNYLNSRENGSDWLHVRFTHRRSAFTDAGFNREIPEYDAVETDYGIRGYTRFSDGSTTCITFCCHSCRTILFSMTSPVG